MDRDDFNTIQSMIQEKLLFTPRPRIGPLCDSKKYLRCGNCGRRLLGMGGKGQQRNTLYLRCEHCGTQVKLPDADLLGEVSRQMTEHDAPPEETYIPSADTIRLTNAINRGLERPDKPEDTVSLILQGISARYDCCPAPTEFETFNRPTEVNFSSFDQAVSHITISDENAIALHFNYIRTC
jgi:DNA-directed RNA polymerase subunit RPC12/RpoP